MYILNDEIGINHYPLTPFGNGIGSHRDHELFAGFAINRRHLNFEHIACTEIFDGDASAKVRAIGGYARQTQ